MANALDPFLEMATPSIQVDAVKKFTEKVDWNQKEHFAFLRHVVFAMNKGYRKGNTLEKEGWDLVIELLKNEDNINVDQIALESHYDTGRRLWQGWKELDGYSGLGWNESSQTFIVPPNVWDNFMKENEDCKCFKHWGYDTKAKVNLYTIYDNNHASGCWEESVGSNTSPQTDTSQEDGCADHYPWNYDSYHPPCVSEVILAMPANIADSNQAYMERARRARNKSEEYKRAINLLRRLPGYDVKNTMYPDAVSLFLNDHTRSQWLNLEDDVELAEQWLKALWDEKNSSN